MKILIVGSGAVGQVFGYFLQKSGVTLGFYARSESAVRLKQAQAQGGLSLYQVSRARKGDPVHHRLADFQIVTDIAGCQAFKPDQIWFTTPSMVFYSDWYHEFLGAVPSNVVVCFAPEGARDDFYPQTGSRDRMVFGGITLIAWQGELARGGERSGAVHFWLPPLVEIPLMGAEKVCSQVAALLSSGGLRTSVKEEDFGKMQASATALLSAVTSGYQLSGWSFAAFRRSPWLKRAARGAREAILSQLPRAGIFTRILLGALLSAPGLWLATFILPLAFPFDLEKYLKYHYQKTREQTLALMGIFAQDGEARGLAVENIRLLHRGLLDGE